MNKVILVSEKPWHDQLFEDLNSEKYELDCIRIENKEKLTYEFCKEFSPDWIFIPHWSYLIPEDIFKNFRCVVFHMTDLPYGRGGSPLQNLIVRGHTKTMVSAISVSADVDAGDVYLKRTLSLHGTAEEIFIRSSKIIEKMINVIILENPKPQKQTGDVVKFKRRKPEDGDISKLSIMEEVYDYIRMLDCEGYPKAFIETENFKFEFNRASLKADKSIKADVRISKK
ncbi:methionyl-tRNA formyltransferase [Gracilimonas sp.]|uniref:methionyl-tRNA formyltransferase n=1 Tax=Gracilimonas sp. TaxID=1974203 RepID=UPI003BABB025